MVLLVSLIYLLSSPVSCFIMVSFPSGICKYSSQCYKILRLEMKCNDEQKLFMYEML
jgi:hypothetical protein